MFGIYYDVYCRNIVFTKVGLFDDDPTFICYIPKIDKDVIYIENLFLQDKNLVDFVIINKKHFYIEYINCIWGS